MLSGTKMRVLLNVSSIWLDSGIISKYHKREKSRKKDKKLSSRQILNLSPK